MTHGNNMYSACWFGLFFKAVKRSGWVVVIAGLMITACPETGWGDPPAGGAPFFKDGDRIVVIGDSLAVGGYWMRQIENYLRTRFPKWNIAMFNGGINGHTSKTGYLVLDTDVLVWKPTVAIVIWGMNDGRGPGGDEQYSQNIVPYVEKLLANNVRVVLCSNMPLDIGDPPGEFKDFNQNFDKMAKFAQSFAAQKGIAFVDMFHFCHTVFGENRKREKPVAVSAQTLAKHPSDYVHTWASGQLTGTFLILKTLNMPAEVSYASIDAASGKAETRRCAIQEFKALPAGKGVSFVRADEACPCWIDDDGAPGLELVPFQSELNRMILRVTGLAPGHYKVEVEDFSHGVFTDKQLAEGVNLSENRLSPVFGPGREVYARNNQHESLVWAARQIREVKCPGWLEIPDLEQQKAKELAKRVKAVEEGLADESQKARPKPLLFRVTAPGPLYREMKIEDDKARLLFDYIGAGLMVGKKDGSGQVIEDKGGKLERFAISGADNKWQWAEAVIDGETVVVSSPGVKEPVAVRYAFRNSEGANLYNRAGAAVTPFRTDSGPSSFIEKWMVSDLQPIALKDASCADPADERLQWRETDCRKGGFVDAHIRIAERPGVVYFVADMDVGANNRGDLYLGYDGPIVVWMNGKKVFEGPGDNPAFPDKTKLAVELKQGKNRVTIALDTHGGNAWGIFARYEQTQY